MYVSGCVPSVALSIKENGLARSKVQALGDPSPGRHNV